MKKQKSIATGGEYVRTCVFVFACPCICLCIIFNSIKKNCSKEKNSVNRGGNLESKVIYITAIGLTLCMRVCVCVCMNMCRGKTHPCNTRVYTRHVSLYMHMHMYTTFFENAARALCSLALPSSPPYVSPPLT